MEKALCLKADAVILDLEDAVAIAEKVATRAVVVDALQSERSGLGYVRVNAYDTDFCFGDLLVVVAKALTVSSYLKWKHLHSFVLLTGLLVN